MATPQVSRTHLPASRRTSLPKRTNDGIKKICGCKRRKWTKCPHPWHFGMAYGKDAAGKPKQFRFSLHRFIDKPGAYIMSKTEAERLRDDARNKIRDGKIDQRGRPVKADTGAAGLTLDAVTTEYLVRYARRPTRRPNALEKFERYIEDLAKATLPNGQQIGAKPFKDVTRADLDDIFDARLRRVTASVEALKQVGELEARGEPVPTDLRTAAALARRAVKGGHVAINRYKARVRHLFNWAIGQGYRDDSPFKRNGVVVLKLDASVERERTRRLEPGEEERLLAVATPYIRAIIIAALSTGCRIGELLTLQWSDVRFDTAGEPRHFIIRAELAKTGESRPIPVAPRLRAVLAMRRLDPAGAPLPATAYVFGNEVGGRVRNIRNAWVRTCAAAGITDLHVHDLRREFACRLLESRAELHDVRAFLGHGNITTTSRYLRSTPVRLEKALGLLDAPIGASAIEAENAALRARLAALEAQLGGTHNSLTTRVPAPADALDVRHTVTSADTVN
jgi:integrase